MLVKVLVSLVRLSASQELDRAQSHLFDSLCSRRGSAISWSWPLLGSETWADSVLALALHRQTAKGF